MTLDRSLFICEITRYCHNVFHAQKAVTMCRIFLTQPNPYHRLLADTQQSDRQQRLVTQLHELGVDYLVSHGEVQHQGFAVLGIGYCGLVLAGSWQQRSVAIKVRRSSCQQINLDNEARLLQRANDLGIGPLLYCHQGDILIMQRLTGLPFGRWLEQINASHIALLKALLSRLLWQGFCLDQAGIDHGALRCVSEHAFVDGDQLTLIDFSHSSDQRHPNNVTSLVAGLLWGTQLAEIIQRWLAVPQRDHLLPALRRYKKQPTQDHFKLLLGEIGIGICIK